MEMTAEQFTDWIERKMKYTQDKDYYPTESELREDWINDCDAANNQEEE